MNNEFTYRIFSLGDSAITIDFGNGIDEKINKKIISLFHFLDKYPLPGMKEVVPAYSSLTVYYDVFLLKKISLLTSAYDCIKNKLEEIISKEIPFDEEQSGYLEIPVCYDGEDIGYVAGEKDISVDDIIQIHSSVTYRVYMIGFLPGFPYMGEIDERIYMPRKKQPRLQVEAGSVAIAGRQTGVYPLNSPGGWQIIGRTPAMLFDNGKENPILLRAGDKVKFYPISKDEFESY